MSTPSNQSPHDNMFTKYPGPLLAIVTLLTVIFSVGATWATASYRIERLEIDYSKAATKQDIEIVKGQIQALSEKLDFLVKH